MIFLLISDAPFRAMNLNKESVSGCFFVSRIWPIASKIFGLSISNSLADAMVNFSNAEYMTLSSAIFLATTFLPNLLIFNPLTVNVPLT